MLTSDVFQIDTVWQVTQQFPNSFEFNEKMLVTIADHVYLCQYGTFLADCQQDAMQLDLPKRTASLWSLINNNLSAYQNPNYNIQGQVTDEYARAVLIPNHTLLSFWSGYYLKYNPHFKPCCFIQGKKTQVDITATRDHKIQQLEETNKKLMQEIQQLKEQLLASPKEGSPRKTAMVTMTSEVRQQLVQSNSSKQLYYWDINK